jgi:hypothetical protein|tara:strand:+ start:242 stop:421 length:180 start_codon:yes stop_codon:yes gene_type:complete
MKKIIGEFTVKGDGNLSLITVYKGEDMMKGISCNPAQLDDKFKEVCLQVEKHVTNNKSK